jgi:hypothetical protein
VTFYWATASDNASLPLADMYFGGTLCGVVAGVVLSILLRNRTPKVTA